MDKLCQYTKSGCSVEVLLTSIGLGANIVACTANVFVTMRFVKSIRGIRKLRNDEVIQIVCHATTSVGYIAWSAIRLTSGVETSLFSTCTSCAVSFISAYTAFWTFLVVFFKRYVEYLRVSSMSLGKSPSDSSGRPSMTSATQVSSRAMRITEQPKAVTAVYWAGTFMAPFSIIPLAIVAFGNEDSELTTSFWLLITIPVALFGLVAIPLLIRPVLRDLEFIAGKSSGSGEGLSMSEKRKSESETKKDSMKTRARAKIRRLKFLGALIMGMTVSALTNCSLAVLPATRIIGPIILASLPVFHVFLQIVSLVVLWPTSSKVSPQQ